jgi:hypothetical protein
LKHIRLALGCAIFVLAFCFVPSAHAADVSGRIKGTITDSTGAVVPNVDVVAINVATGVKATTTSQADGEYQFQRLPVGTYSLTATVPGFKAFTATGIVLNIDQEYVEAIHLSVGNTTDTIEVAADAVQVNTTDMQLNNIVDAKQIVEYPLIGRSFTQLELIEPGVQAASDRFTGNYSVNGGQSQQSSYLINGADTNDFALNTIGILPNIDALDQFNLITGPLNAEYSRNSGAIVSAVVKSGTNHFHGSAFEFYRDTFLNTPGFFNTTVSAGVVKKTTPVFHQNLFGGTIGGPVLKDHLFFFGAYQGDRARQPQTTGNVTVPTVAQRTGNFTGSTLSNNPIPGQVSIPGCVTGTAAGADTYATCFAKLQNNTLPSSSFNPISSALLTKYVPAPNSGTNKYVFFPQTNVIQDQGIVGIDFSPGTKNQINFVGIYQHAPSIDVLPFSGPNLPGFGDQSTSEIRQFTVSYTRQISSTAVNQLALHYTRFNFGSVVPQNVVQPSTAGFAITPQDPSGASLPLISLQGGFAIGFSTNGPQPRIDQNYQVDDNFSKTIGHHTVKFGYDGRRFSVDNNFDASNSGSYSFTAASASANPFTSGNVFLDFELGVPATYGQTANGTIRAKAYENYVYGQDTWKLTNNFTLDYGLGWQIDSAVHNQQYGGQGVNCFVPGQQSKVFPTAPLSLNFPGDPGCNNAQGATTHYADFGPRFGFAYTPNLGFLSAGDSHKLSIRGGFGVYYNRTEEEGSLQNLSQVPFGISSAGIRDSQTGKYDRPSFGNPYLNNNTGAKITNPFPAAFPKPGSTSVVFSNSPLFLSAYSPSYKDPYAENFQLSIQRELPGQLVTTFSYVGSVARHNQVTIEGNPITPAGHAACLADPVCIGNQFDQQVLYPSHTLYPQPINPATNATSIYSASQIASAASSNFNALEISATKGVTHGLSGQISYTYSHALDTASSYEGAGFGGERGYNQYQASTNYGNSDYDTRHRLVIAPIYAIPYRGNSSAFSPLNLALSGWEVSGIVTFATGHPFDVSYQGGEAYALYCSPDDFYYTCPDVPDLTGPLHRINPHAVGAPTGIDGSTLALKGNYFDPAISNPVSNGGNGAIAGATFADESYHTGFFGNLSRNKFYAPGIDNTNIQISKNFRYSTDHTERVIQLRLESYNLFNHTNFSAPNGNPDNGPGIFGVITSAAAARQTQLSGKIYF